jgi:hypothetical protein
MLFGTYCLLWNQVPLVQARAQCLALLPLRCQTSQTSRFGQDLPFCHPQRASWDFLKRFGRTRPQTPMQLNCGVCLAGLIWNICLLDLISPRIRVIVDDGLEISPTFNDRSSSRHEAIEDRGPVRSPRQKCPAGRDTRLPESRNSSSRQRLSDAVCCTRTTDTASTARCTFSLEEILESGSTPAPPARANHRPQPTSWATT